MEQFSFFTLNVALNSLLAFCTTLILIEALIRVIKMKQGRCASYLRMIPLFKLVLDPFLYDFTRWSYLQGINPFTCEEGTRTLSAMFGWSQPFSSGIQFSLPGNLTFTVADMVGHLLPPLMLRSFALTFALVTVLIVCKRLGSFFASAQEFKQLNFFERTSRRGILNPKLASKVKTHRLDVIISPALHGSPFVTGLFSFRVFIPQSLSLNLAQEEYEAVLAHEMEHVCHRDSALRLILAVISAVFWWIPTHWLRERIEEGQEIGCDRSCKKYGVDPVDLAGAICKSAQESSFVTSVFAHHLVKKNQIQHRVSTLLALESRRFKKTRFILAACAVGVAFFEIFLGRYWIF